jgi:hypothetical protein
VLCKTDGRTTAGCRGHHPTGRGPDGRYLDPNLKLPYCHDHHELSHDDWRALWIDDSERDRQPERRLTFIERVERRLRRLAATVGRLAEAHPQHKWWAALARALKCWADELAHHLAAQDRRDPGWRSDPRFYPADA